MRLIIRDDPAVGEYIGKYIAQRINDFEPTPEKPFVLGLPTGSSPIPTYKYLIKLVKEGKLRITLSHTTPSFDIDPKNVHILDGNAPDLIKECKAYEEAIKKAGGIELFLGGIGEDGHIAFNEPGSSLASRTRIKTLAYDTILANSRFFGNDLSKVPRMALTVGVATVLESREVVVVVTGLRKSLALSKAIDATAELHVKTVKYFKSIEMVQQEVEKAHAKDEPYSVAFRARVSRLGWGSALGPLGPSELAPGRHIAWDQCWIACFPETLHDLVCNLGEHAGFMYSLMFLSDGGYFKVFHFDGQEKGSYI
ncbi:glucosamine-6-phosphate isomerase [Rhizoctonia solani AG-1 IA]|uniref:glucosamine-6-phosphate deaminase n=1 Tax=Thanatephorus cucumeris (strain AG1-IA) TaxID=983506 RepID=L8WQS2_THACA|nr:glucosamine-6-phosphate isomerase [Rhizoctonia solani AG-1 IA]